MAPNIVLQRTSACGLAAEAASFGVGWSVTTTFVVGVVFALSVNSVGATSRAVAPSTIDLRDVAVFRAVVDDEDFRLAYGMRDNPVLLNQTYSPWGGHIYNGFVCAEPFLNFDVDPILLKALAEVNRVPRLIPDGPLGIRLVDAAEMEANVIGPEDWSRWEASVGGASRVVKVSRPGYSFRRHAAVVAVERGYAAPCCSDGYLVYLELSGGSWEVCGHGGFWVS
jgi:hypothetical protein